MQDGKQLLREAHRLGRDQMHLYMCISLYKCGFQLLPPKWYPPVHPKGSRVSFSVAASTPHKDTDLPGRRLKLDDFAAGLAQGRGGLCSSGGRSRPGRGMGARGDC